MTVGALSEKLRHVDILVEVVYNISEILHIRHCFCKKRALKECFPQETDCRYGCYFLSKHIMKNSSKTLNQAQLELQRQLLMKQIEQALHRSRCALDNLATESTGKWPKVDMKSYSLFQTTQKCSSKIEIGKVPCEYLKMQYTVDSAVVKLFSIKQQPKLYFPFSRVIINVKVSVASKPLNPYIVINT